MHARTINSKVESQCTPGKKGLPEKNSMPAFDEQSRKRSEAECAVDTALGMTAAFQSSMLNPRSSLR
ncbi:hypothetical protein K8I61_01755 [bacterium]|nr:hypothetical protein [bacterium]